MKKLERNTSDKDSKAFWEHIDAISKRESTCQEKPFINRGDKWWEAPRELSIELSSYVNTKKMES